MFTARFFCFQSTRVVTTILAHFSYLRLVYVPEKASEVAKYGQTQAAMNAVVNGV